MKKTNILTLMLMLTVSVAFGQEPYWPKYPYIILGNKPDGGKIVFNGSNLQMPRIGDGSATDSVLTIVNGVIKKVSRSSITSPTPNLQQVLTAGNTATLGASFGAMLNISSTSSDNRLSIDPSGSLPNLQAKNADGSLSKSLVLQGQEGNLVIGRFYDDGTKLQVNGSAYFENNIQAQSGTIGNAPTQPTHIVRLSDLSGYQTVANLSTNLTASATKYPNVNAVNTGLALKANLNGGNNFVGAQNVKGVLSVNPATGTYPFIQIADNGNLTAFESATSQIAINGSTGRLAFTRGGFTGTINNPTLTADRTWTFPDKTGTFALTSDVSALTLQNVTTAGNTTNQPIIVNNSIDWGIGSYSTGRLYNSTTNGATLVGKTGSMFDFLLLNGVGGLIMQNFTGTSNVEFGGFVRASSNDGNANTLVRNTDLQAATLQTVAVSGTSQSLASNRVYIPHNTSLTTFTLPTTATEGQLFQIVGEGSGGWRISQNASQQIVGVNVATTSGTTGYVQSTNANCTITIRCTVANSKFTITSSQGTLTIN